MGGILFEEPESEDWRPQGTSAESGAGCGLTIQVLHC